MDGTEVSYPGAHGGEVGGSSRRERYSVPGTAPRGKTTRDFLSLYRPHSLIHQNEDVEILFGLNEIICAKQASFKLIEKNVLHLCSAEHKRK